MIVYFFRPVRKMHNSKLPSQAFDTPKTAIKAFCLTSWPDPKYNGCFSVACQAFWYIYENIDKIVRYKLNNIMLKSLI